MNLTCTCRESQFSRFIKQLNVATSPPTNVLLQESNLPNPIESFPIPLLTWFVYSSTVAQIPELFSSTVDIWTLPDKQARLLSSSSPHCREEKQVAHAEEVLQDTSLSI